MLHFFRKIRFKFLKESRFKKLLSYSFIEVFLVVIGILIALTLNNWNSKRMQDEDIHKYYNKLLVEIESKINLEKSTLKSIESNIHLLEIIQNSIATNNFNTFKESVSGLKALSLDGKIWNIPRNHPVFNEFIDKQYFTDNDNEDIKLGIHNVDQILVVSNSNLSYKRDVYIKIIFPYITKNIDYAIIRDFEDSINKGTDLTNYNHLFKSLEFRNIIMLKITQLQSERRSSMGASAVFGMFKYALENEIQEKNK